jgi:DDE superfamily endonuclease/Winged helix-turn helix
MKYVTPLSDAEIETLQQMHAHHPSRRARMRAHSLLLSHQRYTIPHIARIQQVDPRRVSAWIDRWQAWGVVGLYDRPRSGRPAIFTAEEPQHVYAYLDASPKDVKQVVEAMEQKTRKRVSTKTIKRFIKKSPIWKRIKKAPAKAPAPQQYRRSQEMIARLQARESHGECDLWYFDGAGFCLEPYLPYAWQPIGAAIAVPTASHGRRLNGVAFLKRNNDLYPSMIEGSVDTAVIIECFDQLSDQIDKRSYVLLDNAPMHRSNAFIQQIPKWVRKGLIVKYLPSYAPELNLIEILWRFIKYYWLPFSAYTSFQCLCKAVEDILTRFGTDYTITFQAA